MAGLGKMVIVDSGNIDVDFSVDKLQEVSKVTLRTLLLLKSII